jgi:hypothetical protein
LRRSPMAHTSESRKCWVRGPACGGRGTRTHKPFRATVFKTADQLLAVSLLVPHAPFPLHKSEVPPCSSLLILPRSKKGMAAEWQIAAEVAASEGLRPRADPKGRQPGASSPTSATWISTVCRYRRSRPATVRWTSREPILPLLRQTVTHEKTSLSRPCHFPNCLGGL